MSGAHASSGPCTARIANERGRNATALTIAGDGVHLVVRVRGNLSATRFASDDAVSGAALGVHLSNGAYWFYNRDVGAPGVPATGGYELVLTTVTNGAVRGGGANATGVITGDGNSNGTASGTLTAKLPAGRIGGGVLTVTVRFE